MPAILTVDAVLLTLLDSELHVALHKRETEPCKGHWALPGGYVHEDEDSSAKDAAARVLLEKTTINSPYLEEFGTFSGPLRDPRGWSLTVVYFALVAEPMASNLVQLFPVNKLPALCFDHQQIVDSVVERVRNKAGYSSLPVHLVAKEFTISELHAAYESVLGWCLKLTYKAERGTKSIPKSSKRDRQAPQTWRVCDFPIFQNWFWRAMF
jgi:8-oxo-dGTP diphosphatase